VIYFQLNEYEAAAECFQRAIKDRKDQPEFYGNLGATDYFMGRYEEAADHLNQAIGMRTHYPAAHAALGQVYLKLSRYQEAIVSLQKALELNLNTGVLHNDLGCAYARLGNFKEAKRLLERATILRPDFAAAFLNLGVVNLNLKDREAALRQYAVLKTLDLRLAEKLYVIIYRDRVLQVSEAGLAAFQQHKADDGCRCPEPVKRNTRRQP
jgi:tetratricopeptide (TPR) repeat protein